MTAKRRTKRRPTDDNRRRRLEIIAELDRLMAHLLDPAFRGNVGVFVPGKDGRIGDPRFTLERFGVGPE